MRLRAVERIPLTLSLHRRSLFELGQTTTLLFDHLLTCREEGEWISSDLRWKMKQ